MFEIQLDRRFYIVQRDIYGWCVDHFGPPHVSDSNPGTWRMESIFGHTNIFFNSEVDLKFFKKHCEFLNGL